MLGRLNATLLSAYTNADIPMANVASYFDSPSHARVHVAGLGEVSSNVLQVCNLTWMCARGPYGPNLHPNVLRVLGDRRCHREPTHRSLVNRQFCRIDEVL